MALTQERVLELFAYRDGQLVRRISVSSNARAGDVAGTLNQFGYIQVSIDKRLYQAHRVIYLMHHGYMPRLVDHIDRNRSNNRIENLRAATHVQNGYNKSKLSSNSSGYKGVSWCKKTLRWRASISINGKIKFLGRYGDVKAAALAYSLAAEKHHGEFARSA